MPETAWSLATLLDLFLLQLAFTPVVLERHLAQKGVKIISEGCFAGIIIAIFDCLFMA